MLVAHPVQQLIWLNNRPRLQQPEELQVLYKASYV
jgi:hypothetical protein